MEEQTKIQDQIDEINRKLDLLLEEMELQRRQRREMEDLRDDLTRVGTDLYETALDELEELNETLDPADVFLLGKQLLRNVGNVRAAFSQLESARDFMADFGSISKDVFDDVLGKLDELDRKGYFDLLRETGNILDRFASSLTPEDLKRINESVPALAGIVKRLSDPELTAKIERAVSVFEKYEPDPDTGTSLLRLAREMADPDVRRGMMFMLGLFKNIVREYRTT